MRGKFNLLAQLHRTVTVVVTVTVEASIIGITVFPTAVGAGEDLITIEKPANGIVTPAASLVAGGAGSSTETCGVAVELSELVAVARFS